MTIIIVLAIIILFTVTTIIRSLEKLGRQVERLEEKLKKIEEEVGEDDLCVEDSWLRKIRQNARLEILKKHLTWEHGYNPLMLGEDPQKFFDDLTGAKGKIFDNDESWFWDSSKHDKPFLDAEENEDE